MKTILIPTDFSDNAWKAVGFAANIYRDTPCRFILFHAYYMGGSILEADVPHIIADRSKEINRDLTKIKEAFLEFDHHDDTKIEAIARYGEVPDAVEEIVKNESVDLIILGTQGAGNNQDAVLGGSTLGVLEHLPCPVICVPFESSLTGLDHIMFATDYHNLNNLNKLVELKEIAESNDSKVSIVNVTTDLKAKVIVEDEMEILVLHNFFGVVPNEFHDIEADDIEEGILNFAQQKEVNLIVMMNRNISYWKSLFHKSLSKDTALHSTIPLLVLKD
ncbi:MAG: nucleotide-binding universal stress UspA family protein [Crocinitomicaceae bacterium]|jgi:nucleotide-binding universal stress UspA family protein